jgi:hypothetical protein
MIEGKWWAHDVCIQIPIRALTASAKNSA